MIQTRKYCKKLRKKLKRQNMVVGYHTILAEMYKNIYNLCKTNKLLTSFKQFCKDRNHIHYNLGMSICNEVCESSFSAIEELSNYLQSKKETAE